MLEKDIENLIAQHPDEFFPNEGFKLASQQYHVRGRRIDILFEDKFGRKIVIEVKRGILTREASGQIIEYYGLLKQEYGNSPIELILVANNIPAERKTFLENAGIECKELSYNRLLSLANKFGYAVQPQIAPSVEVVFPQHNPPGNLEPAAWICQANPDIYDIFNALSDTTLNTFHWSVNQHADKIKAGLPALIWMSGKDAGIYAVARLLTGPEVMEEFPKEKSYWVDATKQSEARLLVRMSIVTLLLDRPIFRKALKSTKGLENLGILKFAQGTNFPVSRNEWNIISTLIYGKSDTERSASQDAPTSAH
jgi:hypothetical protein